MRSRKDILNDVRAWPMVMVIVEVLLDIRDSLVRRSKGS